MIKIVSWNINSVRLRLDLIKDFVAKNNPDILCLQETKVKNELFPEKEIKKIGFDYVEFDGEKSYNGVAILSKIELENSEKIDILDYNQKRHLKTVFNSNFGKINLHNFYIPAGGDIPDIKLNEKFDHKLKFVDFMADYFKNKKDEKTIILGDFNIAPFEHDVWSHKQLLKVVSHTEIEVEKLNNLKKQGDFVDCQRKFVDESEKLYSWWSYRARDVMKSNRGRRLDHIWATKPLEDKIVSSKIHIEYRIKKQPSDHVPIEVCFDL